MTSNENNDKLIDVFNDNKLLNKNIPYDCMNYINNWNLLMEVVKECYNKEHHQNNYYEAIYYALADLNIEAVYNACVEFIKWWNENSVKEN